VDAAIITTLDSLNFAYPKVDKDQLEKLATAWKELLVKK